MRQATITLIGLLIVGTGCDICPLGQVRDESGVCGPPAAPDAGLAAEVLACWSPDPSIVAPPTRSLGGAEGAPTPTACAVVVGHPAYSHSPACVLSDAIPNDGIDNDCDGTIDEDANGEGGYPAPPPVPKSSIYALGERRHRVEAQGEHCGLGGPCSATVADLGYHCTAAGPLLDARVIVLDRRAGDCLDRPGAPVCGTEAARALLSATIARCSEAARTVRLAWDGRLLTLDRLESRDPREPPMFAPGEFIADLDRALACVAAAVAEVNAFGGAGDADRDGLVDRCDNCPMVDNPGQADRDGDRLGDACDACADLRGPGANAADADGDGRADACDVDADGDGWPDPCVVGDIVGRRALTGDDAPDPPAGMARRIGLPGGAESLWCVRDSDDDRVVDTEDNCRAVANAEQEDADEDGIGDACCGDDDPDDDGIGNCHFLPPMLRAEIAEQAGAPTEVGPHWDPALPVPGEATCAEGRRTCWPSGTWKGELSIADVAEGVRVRVAPDLPHVQRVGPTDSAVAACNEIFRLRFGPDAEWPEAEWRDCIVDNGGEVRGEPPAMEPEPEPEPDPNPPPPARPIEFDLELGDGSGVSVRFGLHGQRVIWWLGGYWRRNECEYDAPFQVELRGVRRAGTIDILCRSTLGLDVAGRPVDGKAGEVVEVKWFRTDVDTWASARVRKFIDQAERLWLVWRRDGQDDPWLRLVYMFGWQPPSIARSILEHDFVWPAPWGGGGPMYEPLGEVAPGSGISDRLIPGPMLAGRAYWTRFIPTDFAFIDGVLDEAPCVACGARPELCGARERRWALNIAGCRITLDGVECGVDGELVEIRLTEATDVYVNIGVLKKWAALYQAWCIQGRALGCNERLSRLYDDLKCTGW